MRNFLPALWMVIPVMAMAQPAALPHRSTLDIPPRLQWNANYGYCGEVSFISAGLYFGQYCSQFTARSLASPGVNQADVDSQLLLGVNDVYAAGRMRLAAEPFYWPTQKSSHDFLAWVKNHIVEGVPVIIGLFNNVTRLGEEPPGDDEYDHIVPVLGVGSAKPFDAYGWLYLPADVIEFSDNGLYTGDGGPAYRYESRFSTFLKNRRAADGPRAPVYSLKNLPNNYGIAITGVADLDGVTIPVRLTASINYEPELTDGSNSPPAPVPIDLTATVSIPDQSVAYKLYRYDNFQDVPATSFNASAAAAVQSWDIPANSGATFQVVHSTNTGATVVFRAVPADAP